MLPFVLMMFVVLLCSWLVFADVDHSESSFLSPKGHMHHKIIKPCASNADKWEVYSTYALQLYALTELQYEKFVESGTISSSQRHFDYFGGNTWSDWMRPGQVDSYYFVVLNGLLYQTVSVKYTCSSSAAASVIAGVVGGLFGVFCLTLIIIVCIVVGVAACLRAAAAGRGGGEGYMTVTTYQQPQPSIVYQAQQPQPQIVIKPQPMTGGYSTQSPRVVYSAPSASAAMPRAPMVNPETMYQ